MDGRVEVWQRTLGVDGLGGGLAMNTGHRFIDGHG